MRVTFYITHKSTKYFEYHILAMQQNSSFNEMYVYNRLISLLDQLGISPDRHPMELIDFGTYEGEFWKVQVIFV